MSPIEIRLDPKLVSSLLDTIQPVLDQLREELASPALLPEDDEMMESFWKSDLLESQRQEIDLVANLFGDEFLDTGRVVIEVEDMDRILRSCSAIRLRLRDTNLAGLDDEQLEQGNLSEVEWDQELQLSYAAYALFASLQEIIVSQMNVMEGEELDSEFGEDDSERDNGF